MYSYLLSTLSYEGILGIMLFISNLFYLVSAMFTNPLLLDLNCFLCSSNFASSKVKYVGEWTDTVDSKF